MLRRVRTSTTMHTAARSPLPPSWWASHRPRRGPRRPARRPRRPACGRGPHRSTRWPSRISAILRWPCSALVGSKNASMGSMPRARSGDIPKNCWMQAPLVDEAVGADGERGDLDVVVDRTGGLLCHIASPMGSPDGSTAVRRTVRLVVGRMLRPAVHQATRPWPGRCPRRCPRPRPAPSPSDRPPGNPSSAPAVRCLAASLGPRVRRPMVCSSARLLASPRGRVMASPVAPPVAPATAESPAAPALAPSDGLSDSVAFAGHSRSTPTVPSSSPRPAPVTGGGCPQYPALRRRTTRCSRSQHGPDCSDRPRHTPSLLTRWRPIESKTPDNSGGLNRSVATPPTALSTTADAPSAGHRPHPRPGTVHTPNRPSPAPSTGHPQFEPHRLSSVPGPGTPTPRRPRHQLQSSTTLVVLVGGPLTGRVGQRVGDLHEESARQSPGPDQTDTDGARMPSALVTSSLTSSAVTSPRESSPQVRSWPRTTARAVRTAPGSAGKLHSAQSPSVSITPITSQARNPPMSGFVGLMGTYPISGTLYRTCGRTVARTAYGTSSRGHGSRPPAPESRTHSAAHRHPRPHPVRHRCHPKRGVGARHPTPRPACA